MFEKIDLAPPDAILGLNDAFKRDTRSDKVNLGVGVYKDETGTTPVMRAVQAAEQRILDAGGSKTYLPIQGPAELGAHAQRLLLGDVDGNARSAQTPGGTGALRVAGDFFRQQYGAGTVWVSDPTWANHSKVFKSAGHEVKKYAYYDADKSGLDSAAMLESLRAIPAGDLVVLHGCCHNPTGFDPDVSTWEQVADIALEKGWLPLFDVAYQGLGDGLDEDAAGLRAVAAKVPELIICSSFSKNFGLYNERIGAFTLRAKTPEVADTAFSQVKIAIRTNYSNPPVHGGAIVRTVLDDDGLTAEWKAELEEMRARIAGMRAGLAEGLAGAKRDFSFLTTQRGMFSYTGLSGEEVDRLREDHGIYAVRSGRINVAGLTPDNLGRVCGAISAVII
jgi:aspartate aminotransferase